MLFEGIKKNKVKIVITTQKETASWGAQVGLPGTGDAEWGFEG